MSKPQASNHRVSVKVAERQYEFLEDRAKELGLSSKAGLLRWYIIPVPNSNVSLAKREKTVG